MSQETALPLRQRNLMIPNNGLLLQAVFVFGAGFIFVALSQAVAALSRQKVIDFPDAIIDFSVFMMG